VVGWRSSAAWPGLVASVSARRIDGQQLVTVEFDDPLQRLSGSAVAQGFRESVEPGGIFGLQGDEFGAGVAPAAGPAAALGSGARQRAGSGSPAGPPRQRRQRRDAEPGARHRSRVCRRGVCGAWVGPIPKRYVTGLQWLVGGAIRPRGGQRGSVFVAGCRRRDRCGERCGRDGRGWRRRKSDRRSRHAIYRPGPGW
jgi:hypothetical protein